MFYMDVNCTLLLDAMQAIPEAEAMLDNALGATMMLDILGRYARFGKLQVHACCANL